MGSGRPPCRPGFARLDLEFENRNSQFENPKPAGTEACTLRKAMAASLRVEIKARQVTTLLPMTPCRHQRGRNVSATV